MIELFFSVVDTYPVTVISLPVAGFNETVKSHP